MSSSKHFNIEELFQEHCQRLTNYIRKKITSNEDAEDIAQHAFIRVQMAAGNSDITNPISYLYQTASNILIDMKRREKLHDAYIHSMVSTSALDSNMVDSSYSTPGPDRIVSAQHELQRIESAVEKMPEKQRQAFLLHRVKGLTYAEIATTMNMSVSSVEKYIFTALKQCRQVLVDKT